jgi:hypothetical protein
MESSTIHFGNTIEVLNYVSDSIMRPIVVSKWATTQFNVITISFCSKDQKHNSLVVRDTKNNVQHCLLCMGMCNHFESKIKLDSHKSFLNCMMLPLLELKCTISGHVILQFFLTLHAMFQKGSKCML